MLEETLLQVEASQVEQVGILCRQESVESLQGEAALLQAVSHVLMSVTTSTSFMTYQVACPD